MTLSDFLRRLEKVKSGSSENQYTAKCPAHDDRNASLSVGAGDNGGIVLHCHAGCATEDILAEIGLKMSDIMPETTVVAKGSRPPVIATYDYTDVNGVLLGRKFRRADKSFFWQSPNGEYKKPKVPLLYNAPALLSDTIYIVEGEKDADTMKRLGKAAISAADGAGGSNKWPPSFNECFKDKQVYLIPDNDNVGRQFAEDIAKQLLKFASTVKILDLRVIYPELSEHGDISDLLSLMERETLLTQLDTLTNSSKPYTPAVKVNPLFSCFKTLDTFNEEEATWLVPGWLPEGQITLIAADGGVGKTTIWGEIISAMSNGSRCFLDPPDHTRKPLRVAFMTTEDSVRKKLKKKLRLAGANMKNIITPDFLADTEGLLRNVKFGTSEMSEIIKHFRPALCVFDPVQGFVPPDINMGSRNEMRDCMAPLITLGEECGTTFLVVCHTNKRKGAYGRDRIADSADLWDISRSVLMAGYTEGQGIRYLSNEKNNYSELQETVLFTINGNGQIQSMGTSWKRDREYMQDTSASKSAPKREACKDFIIHALNEAGGALPAKDLEEQAEQNGYSYSTVRRSKDELVKSKKIKYFQTGSLKNKVWHIQLIVESEFTELSDNEPVPWEEAEQMTMSPVRHTQMN